MQESAPPKLLERRLSAVDAGALVISNVIGVGIFTTPGILAAMVPRPGWMLAAWLAGGALAFVGASAYGELGVRRPRAGGEYVYLREAFGPLAGFLSGWTSFVAGFSGAIAASAVGLVAYLGRFFPAAAGERALATIPLGFHSIPITPMKLSAVGAILVAASVHVSGGPGRRLQRILTALELAALVLLIGLGFASGRGAASNLREAAGEFHPAMWLVALVPVMFTYSGWNAAAYVAEEVREPGRTLPRALLAGTGIVAALYLLLNLLFCWALGIRGLAGVINAGDAAGRALFGGAGSAALVALLGVALAGSVSAMTIAGPRVYFAMARDGVFPATAAIHPRFRTPAAAIAAQALWSSVLVLTGTFEQILLYTGFAVVLFSGLAVAALFVLRRRESARPGQYRAWGWPAAPAVFLLASAAMVASAVRERPGPSVAGIAVILAGVPLYLAMRRRVRRNPGRSSASG